MTTVSIRADGPTFREGEITKILQVAVEVSGFFFFKIKRKTRKFVTLTCRNAKDATLVEKQTEHANKSKEKKNI